MKTLKRTTRTIQNLLNNLLIQLQESAKNTPSEFGGFR
jgi:hypothetical protein